MRRPGRGSAGRPRRSVALRGALLAAAVAALPTDAAARSTPVSELWREWSTLSEAWRAERAERERLRRRLRRLREARESRDSDRAGAREAPEP